MLLFKKHRYKVTSALRRAKQHHYNTMLTHKSKCKMEICEQAYRAHYQVDTLNEMNINGVVLSSTPLANMFNFFFNLVDNTHHELFFIFMRNYANTLFLYPTNGREVLSSFCCHRNRRSCDINDIQIAPVKHVLQNVPPLTHIFSLPISTSTSPCKMQIGKMSLLLKGGNSNAFNNYRPVAILPVCS